MTYEQAFENSKCWISYYYNLWQPKIEFDDYFQECALCFVLLTKKFEPYSCWCYTKLAYKRVMIKLTYRNNEYWLIKVELDELPYYEPQVDWQLELKPHLKEVAELIADGYETDEICQITHKTKETIYTYVRDIKRLYAEFLGIKDYQRKHLRSFTRKGTESEKANWYNKERLDNLCKSKLKANNE